MKKKTRQRTRAELAAEYGISVPALDRAKALGTDIHDPAAMLEHLDNRGRPGKADTSPAGNAYNEARTNLVNLQCEKIRLTIDREAGSLVPAESVRNDADRYGRFIQSRLFALARNELPTRLAGLPAVEILQILDGAVWDLLDDLSKDFGTMTDGVEPTKRPEVSTCPD